MHSAPRAGSRATEARQSNICPRRWPFVQIRSGNTISVFCIFNSGTGTMQFRAFGSHSALNPGSVDSTVHLAAALSEAGQPLEAIDLLVTLLAREPGDRGALETLARAYRFAGRDDDAYRTLSRAAEIHANAPGVRKQLTDTCITLHRLEEAHSHALSLTTVQPDGDSFARLAVTAWEPDAEPNQSLLAKPHMHWVSQIQLCIPRCYWQVSMTTRSRTHHCIVRMFFGRGNIVHPYWILRGSLTNAVLSGGCE